MGQLGRIAAQNIPVVIVASDRSRPEIGKWIPERRPGTHCGVEKRDPHRMVPERSTRIEPRSNLNIGQRRNHHYRPHNRDTTSDLRSPCHAAAISLGPTRPLINQMKNSSGGHNAECPKDYSRTHIPPNQVRRNRGNNKRKRKAQKNFSRYRACPKLQQVGEPSKTISRKKQKDGKYGDNRNSGYYVVNRVVMDQKVSLFIESVGAPAESIQTRSKDIS